MGPARRFSLFLTLAVIPFVAVLGSAGTSDVQPPPDLDAFARKVREGIRLEYAEPFRFNYVEEGRDVEISMFGKVSVGPVQTFEVRQNPDGGKWRRLIAVDGKPVGAAELARQDAEHERLERKREQRDRTETPGQRAERLKEETDELRERDEILDDAARVFAFSYVSHDAIDGHPVVVVDLTPRPNARVTTSDGQRMKKFAGRLWVSESDNRLARVRLNAVDSVSVGWGVVARVDRGSGFDFVRKNVGGTWVASTLTIEGSGNTLLFRRFQLKTVTTYSKHQPYGAATPNS